MQQYNKQHNVLTNILLQFIQDHKLSQELVANMIGTHRANIAKYLNNKIYTTYTILKRLNSLPSNDLLVREIKSELNKCNNKELLMQVYNMLNKSNNEEGKNGYKNII